jgi:hypothetical protein
MQLLILSALILYCGAMAYIYFTQEEQVFNRAAIDENEPFILENMEKISYHAEENVILDGALKHSKKKDAPLLLYFGGNADDATRILLHVKNLSAFDILAFNYRGYMQSTGRPSEKNLFSDALKLLDTYGKNKKVIVIGRSLGSGVATYLASKREVQGLILITPYDSIVSIAKKKYPIFPINTLLKYKFQSVKYMPQVKTPVGLIEVKDDETVPVSHFNALKKTVLNLSLYVRLEGTTHGDVLTYKDFEKSLKEMIEKML